MSEDGVNALGSAADPFNVNVNATSVTGAAVLTALASGTAAIAVNAQNITGVADPVNPQDADTKNARINAINAATVTMRMYERFVSPAPGATIHASIAAGAPLNVTTAFTQIIEPTNVRLSRGGAGAVTHYTVTGTRFGVAQVEIIASNGASDVEGVKIFDTITLLTSDVDPTVTTTVKTGVILGLANVAVSIDFMGTAATSGSNAVAEVATLNAAKDGFTPTTTPDGTKVQVIRYLATFPVVAH